MAVSSYYKTSKVITHRKAEIMFISLDTTPEDFKQGY